MLVSQPALKEIDVKVYNKNNTFDDDYAIYEDDGASAVTIGRLLDSCYAFGKYLVIIL